MKKCKEEGGMVISPLSFCEFFVAYRQKSEQEK